MTGLRIGAILVASAITMLVAIGTAGHLARMQLSAPYQMVEVEPGRHLHTLCEGPVGAPFVLYDAGAFGIYTDGWWIKEELKQDHRVCLYDRAGMGWSDPVPADASPHPDWHVADMRRLRAALGAEDAFVLIGHSMSGLRLHAYANSHPNELMGLVFVDAARPQTMNSERAQQFLPWAKRVMSLSAGLARVGIAGGAAFMFPDELNLPPRQKRDKRRSIAAVSHHKATRAEIVAAFEAPEDATWRTETNAQTLQVAVYTNSTDGGSNGPVAEAAEQATGYGRVRSLPDESHVSLLNRTNAAKIASDVRDMTKREQQ